MKLHKQKSIWRAKTMDDMYRAIEKGEMTVEEMIDGVGTLDKAFAQELSKKSQQQEEERQAKEDGSLELDIDEPTPFPVKPKKLRLTPRSSESETIQKRMRRTRDMLHSSGSELPKSWTLEPR
jgi:hypothetical protein